MTTISLLLLLVVSLAPVGSAFAPISTAKISAFPISRPQTGRSSCVLLGTSHSEYTVIGDDGEEDVAADLPVSDVAALQHEDNEDTDECINDDTNPEPSATKQRPEYGALAPGTVVQVQVGDMNLARKAWKKRRRTGSPLLVPCSVLNVDRQSMVRWNLIHLLEKFGQARNDGISIDETQIAKSYRSFLKSSLQKQALALGYETGRDMIIALFNKKTQESYGVRLVEEEGKPLLLKAPISRRKAQFRAAGVPVLQFRFPHPEDHGDSDTMTHTGHIKSRRPNATDRDYHFLPLSAALRVSQKDDIDSGRVEEGSIYPAVVFDFDLTGDGGSPLLTLSLNPGGVRDSLKVKPDRNYTPIDNPQHLLHEVSVGDGPFRAKVVQFQPGKALVDFGVGRKASNGYVRVLGTLRFQDSVAIVENKIADKHYSEFEDDDFFDEEGTLGVIEDLFEGFDDDDDNDDNDVHESVSGDDVFAFQDLESMVGATLEEGETEEDISEYFALNEDGTLTYSDPESGEATILGVNGADDEDESDEEYEDDVEEDGEGMESGDLDEDITDIFAMNDDGSLLYLDPESGESIVIAPDDEDFEEMLAVKNLIDSELEKQPTPKRSTGETQEHETRHGSLESNSRPKLTRKMLKVGEDIEVFIRSMSKQSGHFTVTTNPLVQGRKAKELKKEGDAEKKLKRLRKSMGGNLKRIWDLRGEECDGWVKATSKTGDWLYVQPDIEGFPVGIALSEEDLGEIAAGDRIRVRISGVDVDRGQLEMQVVR